MIYLFRYEFEYINVDILLNKLQCFYTYFSINKLKYDSYLSLWYTLYKVGAV